MRDVVARDGGNRYELETSGLDTPSGVKGEVMRLDPRLKPLIDREELPVGVSVKFFQAPVPELIPNCFVYGLKLLGQPSDGRRIFTGTLERGANLEALALLGVIDSITASRRADQPQVGNTLSL